MSNTISAAGWKAAEEQADRAAPMPKTSSALGAAMGFFGGGMLAMVILSVAGMSYERFPGSLSLGVCGLICAVAAYAYFRAQERAHSKAYVEAVDRVRAEEERERRRSPVMTD